MFIELFPVVLALFLPLAVCYGLARLTVKCAGQYPSQKFIKLLFIFRDQEDFVEGFLRRVLFFLRAGNCNKLKLVVVNDASSDDTGAILNRLARKNGCYYLDSSWEAVRICDLLDNYTLYYDMRQAAGGDWKSLPHILDLSSLTKQR